MNTNLASDSLQGLTLFVLDGSVQVQPLEAGDLSPANSW